MYVCGDGTSSASQTAVVWVDRRAGCAREEEDCIERVRELVHDSRFASMGTCNYVFCLGQQQHVRLFLFALTESRLDEIGAGSVA